MLLLGKSFKCCCFWLDFGEAVDGPERGEYSWGRSSMFLASKLVRLCVQFPGVLVLSSGVSFNNFGKTFLLVSWLLDLEFFYGHETKFQNDSFKVRANDMRPVLEFQFSGRTKMTPDNYRNPVLNGRFRFEFPFSGHNLIKAETNKTAEKCA